MVLTLHVDEHVLVDVTVRVGRVTPVVAGVFLHEVGDGDAVGGDLPAGVVLGLLYGLPVVDPRDGRLGCAARPTLDDGRLALRQVLELGLLDEERSRWLQIIQMR